MATRALAAAVAGRRVAGQSAFPALASSSRRGGVGACQSDWSSRRSAHAQAEDHDHDAPVAEGVTAAQVEAALNSKNVEEVVHEVGGRAATVTLLPDEIVDDADAAWVPDQDTGVFVPAEEAAASAASSMQADATLNVHGHGAHDDDDAHGAAPAAASVLDQMVFNREEEMEDVERPAVDMDAN